MNRLSTYCRISLWPVFAAATFFLVSSVQNGNQTPLPVSHLKEADVDQLGERPDAKLEKHTVLNEPVFDIPEKAPEVASMVDLESLSDMQKDLLRETGRARALLSILKGKVELTLVRITGKARIACESVGTGQPAADTSRDPLPSAVMVSATIRSQGRAAYVSQIGVSAWRGAALPNEFIACLEEFANAHVTEEAFRILYKGDLPVYRGSHRIVVGMDTTCSKK